MRRRFGVARGARWLAIAALLGGSGCGGKIVRLTSKGAYDEAIEAAAERKVPPRGRAARAYATALHERGRDDQARAVLLHDYRHGGDLRSFVQLADLERELGLLGMAASHYGRIAELKLEALEGRPEACELLRQRAAVWATEGAGEAAAKDLERAQAVCGEPSDPAVAARLVALRQRVEAAAQAEVDARVQRTRCTEGCDEIDHDAVARAHAEALEQARAEGPAALRARAARLRAQLPAADVVAILLADMRGEAGAALITDDELRARVGEQHWADLAPVAMSEKPEVAAYLQLRLAAVLPDVPVTLRSRTGPGELDLWLAKSLEVTDRHAWRVLAWAGDVTGAELALGAEWRPARAQPAASVDPSKSPKGAGAGEGAAVPEPVPAPAIVDGVEPPEHWTARVAPTEDNFGALLLEGRLRYAAGQSGRSLEIHRYVLARAHAAALAGVDAAAAEQAAWHLAHGRPWHAMALARTVDGPASQRVVAAAASALRLTEALCGGPCKEDRDLDRVESTMGEAWIAQQRAQLVELSRARTQPASAADGCPTLPELLASDAEGRLAKALADVRTDPSAPGRARQLGQAIEADLGLSCAASWVVPLLRVGGHEPTAAGLAESLSHDATLDAAPALLTHATLAMVGQREPQASLLATAAAAASPDPAATWRVLARHAHASGHRELTLRSLREALMHTPGLDDPELSQALLIAGLAGIADSWNLRETEAGPGELSAHVADWIERAPPEQRWAVREQLARALAEQPWLDNDARVRLAPALWPDPATEAAHPVARAWLSLRSGGTPDLEPADVGPLDVASLELLVTMRALRQMPTATATFVDPAVMEGLRLAVVRHSREYGLRWRTAIGLATHGSPRARAEAMIELLAMVEPPAREALLQVVLDDPVVVEPGEGGALREAALVSSPEHALAVVFGVPLDPLGL